MCFMQSTNSFSCDQLFLVCTSNWCCWNTSWYVVLEMWPWKYQHWRNMVTNDIYNNNHCDIYLSPLVSHFPITVLLAQIILRGPLTFELPASSKLQILLGIGTFKFSKIAFTFPRGILADRVRIVTSCILHHKDSLLLLYLLSHTLPAHSFFTQVSGITTPFSLPCWKVSLTWSFLLWP